MVVKWKYFEKETAKSKYRGRLKYPLNTADAGYSKHTVRRIVAEKFEIRDTRPKALRATLKHTLS